MQTQILYSHKLFSLGCLWILFILILCGNADFSDSFFLFFSCGGRGIEIPPACFSGQCELEDEGRE